MSKRKSKKEENVSDSDNDSDSSTDKSEVTERKTSKKRKHHKRRHDTTSESDSESSDDSSSDSDDDHKRRKNKKHKKNKKSKKHKKHSRDVSEKPKKESLPVSSDDGGHYSKKPHRDEKKFLTEPIVHTEENWDAYPDGVEGGNGGEAPPEHLPPRSQSSDRIKQDESRWDRSPEKRDERPRYDRPNYNRNFSNPRDRRSRSNEPRRRPEFEHRDDRRNFGNFNNRRDDFNHHRGRGRGRGGWNRNFNERRFNDFNDDRRQDNWHNKNFDNRNRYQNNDRFQNNDRHQKDHYQNDRYQNNDRYKNNDRRDDFRRPRNDDRESSRNNDREYRESRNTERSHSYQRDDDRKPFRRFKQEKDEDYDWGKPSRSSPDRKKGSRDRSVEKEKPNFGLSGKLTEDTNKVNGVIIKYSEPPEARKPKRRWRLYPFKGEETLPTMYIHRQSCYLIGRDRKICDLPVDHPSCSKQHAVLQYRLVPFERDDGTLGKRVRPYIIDLESANGTFINNKQIEPKKYVEILEKDVLKFGFSSREYVMLHENSKEDQEDDDVAVD